MFGLHGFCRVGRFRYYLTVLSGYYVCFPCIKIVLDCSAVLFVNSDLPFVFPTQSTAGVFSSAGECYIDITSVCSPFRTWITSYISPWIRRCIGYMPPRPHSPILVTVISCPCCISGSEQMTLETDWLVLSFLL